MPENPFTQQPPGQEVFSHEGRTPFDWLAAAHGALYGSGFEGVPQVMANPDEYSAALIMANRSPTMGLGMDPRRHLRVSPEAMREATERLGFEEGTLRGLYMHPPQDMVVTETTDKWGGFNPTVYSHENVHRGLQHLGDLLPDEVLADPEYAEALDDLEFVLSDPARNEALARYLHHAAAGTSATEWERERWGAVMGKHAESFVESIERLSEVALQSRGRKGGPR